jgi:hypothetical protein
VAEEEVAVLGVELRAAAGEGGGQRAGVLDRHEAVALAVPEVDRPRTSPRSKPQAVQHVT